MSKISTGEYSERLFGLGAGVIATTGILTAADLSSVARTAMYFIGGLTLIISVFLSTAKPSGKSKK